ncbi:MAG: PEP-CTERM sorting domain-containing protein [Alphaproteobacteria bacterium]|nr:PEP-CTERM sorting domain-containing protein [Alphaproteobacteria bacterium]
MRHETCIKVFVTNRLGLVCASLASSIVATTSTAGAITFDQITNNSGQNYAADFSLEVTDLGSNQALFKFSNAAGATGIITLIVFDDVDADLNIGTIAINAANTSAGVNFVIDGSPANLPAGNNAVPPFDDDRSVSRAAAGGVSNGIDGGEMLGLTITLSGMSSFAELIGDLEAGTFRVGFHGQSLGAQEQSESYINTVPPPGGGEPPRVPAPGGLALFALGAAALLFRRFRR